MDAQVLRFPTLSSRGDGQQACAEKHALVMKFLWLVSFVWFR